MSSYSIDDHLKFGGRYQLSQNLTRPTDTGEAGEVKSQRDVDIFQKKGGKKRTFEQSCLRTVVPTWITVMTALVAAALGYFLRRKFRCEHEFP